jgi:hypothetical protein
MVIVAVVDPPPMKIWVGGYGGGQTGGGGGGCGRRPQWRKKQRGYAGSRNWVREAGFFAVFGQKFLHP